MIIDIPNASLRNMLLDAVERKLDRLDRQWHATDRPSTRTSIDARMGELEDFRGALEGLVFAEKTTNPRTAL